MNSRTTRQFRDLLAALPDHVRRQARDAYLLFRQNPAHPGLRFKKVHADPPIFPLASVSVIAPWVRLISKQSSGSGSALMRSMNCS